MYFDEPLIGKTETKPDVFSLESLIAWLEKQPADGAYCYDNPRNCLLAQWIHELTGLTGADLGGKSCVIGATNLNGVGRVAYPEEDTATFDFTFGAALSRARTASQGRG